MDKFLPVIFSSLLMLTACGGSGSSSESNDTDSDSVLNILDNCPTISNADQLDSNNDGVGDLCEAVSNTTLDKIKEYADTSGVSGLPSIEDYVEVGVVGVDETNITAMNLKIAESNSVDIDSTEKLQETLDELGLIVEPLNDKQIALNKVKQYAETSGTSETPNLDDYIFIGIEGITETIALNLAVAESDVSEIDTTSEIQIILDSLKVQDDDNDGVTNLVDEFPNDSTKASSVNNAHRLLTQSTFGATEEEIDRVVKIGVNAWVEEQLNSASAYDNDTDDHRTHLERTEEIAFIAEPLVPWVGEDYAFNSGGGVPIWNVTQYQMSAWWENALGHPTNTLHGSDQLRQRVAYALSQLLVVSGRGPRLGFRGDSLAYYYDLLAKNALGNYRTLLGDISRSPTMGAYLSYQGNQKADPIRSTRPDENFARELIQLFTIGLVELNLDASPNRDANTETYPDTGNSQVASYTQDDVVELSKVMTGWDVKDNNSYGNTNMGGVPYATAMEFHPEYHEDEVAAGGDGNVTVLGETFALNSGNDGSGLDTALDVIFQHPNIGPFVSKSLIMNLITSNPSSAYVARVASVFNNNGEGVKGDLKAVIGAILYDTEARNQDDNFGKLKEPFLVFTQLLRTFNATPLDWQGPTSGFSQDARALVTGVYSYRNPEDDFGQAPLRADSVFNFFQSDYVPSQEYFSQNGLVSPEAQIKTDGNILSTHNNLAQHFQNLEKNWINDIRNQTLSEFSADRRDHTTNIMVNYDDVYDLFEQALEGDNNGDFANIASTLDRERAIDALLVYLDKVMLGNSMDGAFRLSLRTFLLSKTNYGPDNNVHDVYILVNETIRFIATSTTYFVQK